MLYLLAPFPWQVVDLLPQMCMQRLPPAPGFAPTLLGVTFLTAQLPYLTSAPHLALYPLPPLPFSQGTGHPLRHEIHLLILLTVPTLLPLDYKLHEGRNLDGFNGCIPSIH